MKTNFAATAIQITIHCLCVLSERAKKSNQGRETTYSLEDPSADRVQSMKIFPLEVAKLLKLQRSGKDFKFLELEVYNAPFPGNVCTNPITKP